MKKFTFSSTDELLAKLLLDLYLYWFIPKKQIENNEFYSLACLSREGSSMTEDPVKEEHIERKDSNQSDIVAVERCDEEIDSQEGQTRASSDELTCSKSNSNVDLHLECNGGAEISSEEDSSIAMSPEENRLTLGSDENAIKTASGLKVDLDDNVDRHAKEENQTDEESLKVPDDVSEKTAASGQKRKRGRPSKESKVDSEVLQSKIGDGKPRRKRGRPRKEESSVSTEIKNSKLHDDDEKYEPAATKEKLTRASGLAANNKIKSMKENRVEEKELMDDDFEEESDISADETDDEDWARSKLTEEEAVSIWAKNRRLHLLI